MQAELHEPHLDMVVKSDSQPLEILLSQLPHNPIHEPRPQMPDEQIRFP